MSSSQSICAGECIKFNTLLDFFPEFHAWSFPGAIPATSNVQNPQKICYPTPGLYPVTLIYENCFDRDTIIKTDYIQVLPAPQPTGPAQNEAVLTAGSSIILEACATGDSYAWSPPSGLSCTDCPAPVVSTTASTTYTLLVSTNGACTDTCTYAVLVGERPVAALSPARSAICEGGCVGFSFTGSGAVDSYAWHFPGGEPATSTTAAPQGICYPAAGSYPVILVVENAFGSDSLVLANAVTVSPAVQLTGPAVQSLQLSFGDTVQLAACATGDTYRWSPPDGLSCTDCPAPVLVAAVSANYTLEVSNGGACGAECKYPVTVSFDEALYAPTAFSPNGDGVNDFFTLYSGKGFTRITELAVFDRWGGLLFRAQDIPPGSEPQGWDGTQRGEPLEQGVYTWYARAEAVDGSRVFLKGGVLLVR